MVVVDMLLEVVDLVLLLVVLLVVVVLIVVVVLLVVVVILQSCRGIAEKSVEFEHRTKDDDILLLLSTNYLPPYNPIHYLHPTNTRV